MATDGCRAAMPGAVGDGGIFVALADRGNDGVAFLLDRSRASVIGRVDIGGAPEGAVDWNGNRLLLFCSVTGTARLVAYDLSSLREQWQIPVEGRSITKAPGGLPALAVGGDGRFVFILHYKTLRPGDANAPGASITWLTAHDARTGLEQGRVDFPDCVAARIFVASDGAAYVMCRDQLYAIDTTTWSVAQVFPFSSSVGPVGIVGDRAMYGVTRELEVLAVNLKTGETTRIGKSNGTGATAQAWGRLTIAPSGSTVWVISRASRDRAEYDPDTLAVVSLNTWSVFEMRVPGLRGVGLVGARVVYGAGGSLRSTDGAIDKTLIDGRVDYWHIFADHN
jgi:outer membrane protein assembly factor BamB